MAESGHWKWGSERPLTTQSGRFSNVVDDSVLERGLVEMDARSPGIISSLVMLRGKGLCKDDDYPSGPMLLK